jgi:hypothetical protein
MRFASSGQGGLVTGGFAGAWLRELNLVGLGMDHGQLSRLPGEGKGPGKGHVGRNDGSLCPLPSTVLGSLGTYSTVQYSSVLMVAAGRFAASLPTSLPGSGNIPLPPNCRACPQGSSLRVRAGHISQRALSRYLSSRPSQAPMTLRPSTQQSPALPSNSI